LLGTCEGCNRQIQNPFPNQAPRGWITKEAVRSQQSGVGTGALRDRARQFCFWHRLMPMNTSRRVALAALCGGALSRRAAGAGSLLLHARSRPEGAVREEVLRWNPSETAIIICDMWDNHYCESAARRVKAMAPRMNQVIAAARDLGVTIVHAPSG